MAKKKKTTRKDSVGIITDMGNTFEEAKEDEDSEKDIIKRDIVFKSITIDGTGDSQSSIDYAIPPVEMDKLYTLYKEDETIAGLIDKTASVASSEKFSFESTRDGAIDKAKDVLKQCYIVLEKTEEGNLVKKRIMAKEFFRYLFTDRQIYNNSYWEVKRSLDGAQMAFVYKDPRYIRVLKNHTGFVEIAGINKYFYNNYTPDRRERQMHRLHYKEGFIKGNEPISSLNKRELIHIRGYGNQYYGLTPLYSIAISSLMQSRSKQLPVNLLGNGMINTPVVTFSGAEVNAASKKEIDTKLRYKAVGTKNAGSPVIIFTASPNSKVDVKGMPKHEFDLDQVKAMYKLGESNVLKRFGFPPEKLSILDNSNRATITESDQIMTEEIVNPIQSLFEYQMNIIFQDDLGLDVEFKFADKIYNIEKLSKVSKEVRGMSANEIRVKILNIAPSDDPLADEIILSNTDRFMSQEPTSATPAAQKDRIGVLKDEIKQLMEMRKQYEHKDD